MSDAMVQLLERAENLFTEFQELTAEINQESYKQLLTVLRAEDQSTYFKMFQKLFEENRKIEDDMSLEFSQHDFSVYNTWNILKKYSVQQLKKYPTDETVNLLHTILHSDSELLNDESIRTLGAINTPNAHLVLIEALQPSFNHKLIISTLEKCEALAKAEDELINQFRSYEYFCDCEAIAIALVKIGSKKSLDALLSKGWKSVYPLLVEYKAVNAIDILIKWIRKKRISPSGYPLILQTIGDLSKMLDNTSNLRKKLVELHRLLVHKNHAEIIDENDQKKTIEVHELLGQMIRNLSTK